MSVIEADLLVLRTDSNSTNKKRQTCMQDPPLNTVTSSGEKLNDARLTAETEK